MPAPRLNKNSRFNPKKAALCARYAIWKAGILHLARCARWTRTGTLRVVFILPLPKTASKRKIAELLGRPHLLTPDTDNLTKALKDALYPEQDNGVWREDCEKRWGLTGEIRMRRAGIAGLEGDA
jgi:Holliday junction resolvase RusA-like endonuclease